MERAVLVIPLPIYEGEAAAPDPDTDASTSASRAEQPEGDLRLATPLSSVDTYPARSCCTASATLSAPLAADQESPLSQCHAALGV